MIYLFGICYILAKVGIPDPGSRTKGQVPGQRLHANIIYEHVYMVISYIHAYAHYDEVLCRPGFPARSYTRTSTFLHGPEIRWAAVLA